MGAESSRLSLTESGVLVSSPGMLFLGLVSLTFLMVFFLGGFPRVAGYPCSRS